MRLEVRRALHLDDPDSEECITSILIGSYCAEGEVSLVFICFPYMFVLYLYARQVKFMCMCVQRMQNYFARFFAFIRDFQ